MGAVELGKKIARGAITSMDATRAMLERIERLNGSLKCYELVMAEQALSDARRAEARRSLAAVDAPDRLITTTAAGLGVAGSARRR